MQNCKTSAGTAAKQSSKRSLLVRSALLLAILLLSAVFCQAQITTDSTWKVAADSCWWEKRIDTIQTDFVIIVDENNFVKKQKVDFIVHEYETQKCKGFVILFLTPNRNDIFLLDNKPVEVLLYRPKGQRMLVGNSR
jgi:hypothetical protein